MVLPSSIHCSETNGLGPITRCASVPPPTGFVNDFAGVGDSSAERLADGLLAQADPQDRRLAGEVLDDINADAGLFRRAGTGGDHDLLRRHHFDVLDGHLVVAHHLDVGTQFAEVLVEVVGEAVVVIDKQDHVEAPIT